MAGLDDIRERMTAYLNEQGIAAVSAWPERERRKTEGAVAAVSLRKCESTGHGFGDYLGERYDRERDKWEELYGKKVILTFGLDLYAGTGETGGEAQVRTAFDKLAQALQTGCPAGLRVKELSCGETGYDKAAGRYRCPAEAVCEAYLYAIADEGGVFLDFEVKGAGQI